MHTLYMCQCYIFSVKLQQISLLSNYREKNTHEPDTYRLRQSVHGANRCEIWSPGAAIDNCGIRSAIHVNRFGDFLGDHGSLKSVYKLRPINRPKIMIILPGRYRCVFRNRPGSFVYLSRITSSCLSSCLRHGSPPRCHPLLPCRGNVFSKWSCRQTP